MKTIGFILLGLALFCYLVALIIGLIAAMPFGIVDFFVLGGVLFLLIHVIGEKMGDKEDQYYKDNVDL